MTKAPALLLAMAVALPLQGCCSLARLFCGPDRSPWVPIAFNSPEATARTFLEAIRREHFPVLWECLAPGFRSSLGMEDPVAGSVGWAILLEEYPHLFMLGYAELSPPTTPPQAPDRRRFSFRISGYQVSIRVRRRSYSAVHVRTQFQDEPYVMDSTLAEGFGPWLLQRPTQGQETWELLLTRPFTLEDQIVPSDAIEQIIFGTEWRVVGLDFQEAPGD